MSVRQLPENLQKRAEEELNETPQRSKDCIQHIKDWLSKQPHLNINPDDQLILSFLRGCKFRTEKTKEKIDYYYSTKTLYYEVFLNRDPSSDEIQKTLNAGRYLVPLPKSDDPLAPRIFLYPDKPYTPSESLNAEVQFKVIQMVMDIMLLEDDSFVINGFQIIQFLSGFSIHHLAQLSPILLRKFYLCTVKRYPARMNAMHFVNLPSAGITMYNILKPFISQKVQSRTTFHKDYSELHKLIPKSNLPKELGGENYNVSDILNEWNHKIMSYKSWFLEDEGIRSDESKRIINSDTYGVQGCFRKLEVD